ncbi:MAG: DUF3343 domain-containing protein [Peptostreptococcaceae bacterium]|nr:DUF3343 domain-containing protein [Peptostreptococcaceae bacterium]
MREKQEKLIVTFRTTTGAMAMEKACITEHIKGRLIPVPRSITAGCGMCWMTEPNAQEEIETLVIERKLDVDGFYLIKM